MAPRLQFAGGMIGSSLTLTASLLARLRIGVGYGPSSDLQSAVVQAAVTAQTALEGATPHLAMVVTAGVPKGDIVAPVRAVLGPVGVAGGVTSGLLTEQGCMTSGALVIAVADAEHAASGVSVGSGQDLSEAGRAAARIMLAGWPFRHRYPRGLGFAFARAGHGSPAATFLDAWRELMGPKMRTVCATLPAGPVFGSASSTPLVSVACLEASYSTGLGFAEGFALDQPRPDAEVLTHGAVDATITALKRLEEDPLRLVVVVESAARREALGRAADREWQAIRHEVAERAPCVGWLCEQVAAYGRGVRPVDVMGSLVVVSVGDPPEA